MSARYDRLASALKTALPDAAIDALGRVVSFIRRLREIRAALFVWSVVMSRFGHGRPGFEEARRWFVRLGGADLWRRPFQVRFKAASAVRLFEEAFATAVSVWRSRRHRRIGHPLATKFADVVLIDSTTIQLSVALSDIFKPSGNYRVDGTRPGLMKALLCVSVFGLVPLYASLHAGPRADTHIFPPLDLFAPGTLLIFDKGFFWKKHLRAMASRGLHYLFPMKKYVTPRVLAVVEGPKYLRRALAQRGEVRLRDVLARDARVSGIWDLDVMLDDGTEARLVIVPGPRHAQRSFLTTLSRNDWPPRAIAEMYRLRWQIELVFKELKQDLNLERVPTNDPHAAQVFVWGSLLALAVSRRVCAAMYPPTDRLGLAARARPSLTTRALRATARLLARAWVARGALQRALLRLVLSEIDAELTAITSGRPDSFARLLLLAPAPS